MSIPDGNNESAPLGFDAEGWPLPEVRSLMIDNFTRSWTKRWYAVIIIFIISICLVIFPMMLITPRWEAEAMASINEQALPVLTVASNTSTSVDKPDAGAMVANLIEIAKSRPFITTVVRDMDLAAYFEENSKHPELRDKIKKTAAYIITLRFLRRPGVTDWEKKAVDELQEQWISSRPLDKTTMLPLLVYGDQADKACEVADAMLDHLRQFMDDYYRSEINSLIPAIEHEINVLNNMIAADDQKIVEFLTQKGYSNPQTYADRIIDSIASLENDQATIDLDIQSTLASVTTLKTELDKIPELVNLVGESDVEKPLRTSDQLMIEIARIKSERMGILASLPANSPQVKSLDAQITSLDEEYQTALNSEKQLVGTKSGKDTIDPKYYQTYSTWLEALKKLKGLEARKSGLESALETLQVLQKDAIYASQTLDSMERLKKQHISQHDLRLAKLIEFQTMLAQPRLFNVMNTVVPASVKDMRKADFPNLLLTLVIAFVVGVFTALVFPVGYDYVNQTLMSSRQASAVPGVRVIATVPRMKSRKMYKSASV